MSAQDISSSELLKEVVRRIRNGEISKAEMLRELVDTLTRLGLLE